MKQRGNITWSNFWNGFCRKNLDEFAFGMGVIMILSALVFIFVWDATNNPLDEKLAVAEVLTTAHSPTEMSELATRLLKGSDLYDNSSTEDFLREVQQHGVIPPITEQPLSWYDDFLTGWLPGIGLAFLVGTQLIIAYNLSSESYRRQQRIMDLPWRKPWVWAFVTLTIVPGVLYYPVSIYRVIQDRRALSKRVEETPEEEVDLTTTIRYRNRFEHDPDAARVAYRRSRIGDRRRDLEEQRDRAQSQVARLTGELKRLTERLRTAQREKGEQLAIVSQTEQLLEELVEVTPEEAQVTAEFERLMRLPGVVGVNAIGDTVHVLVYVTLKYGLETYFQGVWEITFDAAEGLRVQSLETGVKYSWRYGVHPDYRDHDDRYRFCMGSRREEILGYAESRRYLEAVELLINCFISVNPQDEHLIPEVFRKVGEYP